MMIKIKYKGMLLLYVGVAVVFFLIVVGCGGLKSKKANLTATNYFFVKLFNGAFILQKFDVKRLDDESVSFSVEIRS